MLLQLGVDEAVFADHQAAGPDQDQNVGGQVVVQKVPGNLGAAEHGFEEMVVGVV